MENFDKEVLRKNRLRLAKELDLEELLQILVTNGILSDHQVEKILCKSTRFNKNVEFLNILPTRGPEAFSCFVNALNETEQTHLANCLANTKLANHCTNVDKNFSVCNEESTFPLSSFHFSQNTSCKKNTSKRCVETCHNQSSCDTMQMPIRFPSEHDEQVSSQITVGQSPPPSKRQCCVSSSVDETMEVIPSPCNALSDLESTATMESLEMDAQLSAKPTCPQKDAISARPHLQAGNTATENQRYSLNNAQPMKNLLSIDLADGPHRDDLIVQHANMQHFLRNEINSYPMQRKGLALIVSVDRFEPASCLENRLAGDVDRARLEFVLRQLGFKCYVLVDGTAREIWSTLQKFAALDEHYSADCMIMVIMSHGHDGVIYGRDGMPVSIEKTLQLFNNENCRSLQNKPKVVLVQACRGDKPDKGVDESDSPAKMISCNRIQSPEDDLNTCTRSGPRPLFQNKLPTSSDFLVGYATVKGFAAMRNTKHGSWYIQALVRVLAHHACDKHLIDIMTIVNSLVKGREGHSPASEFHRCKEMPDFISSLCKDLFFFPGL